MATIKEKEKAKVFVQELLQADSALRSVVQSVNIMVSKYQGIIKSGDPTEKNLIKNGLTSENLDIDIIVTDLEKFQTIIDFIEANRPKYKE